MTVVNRNNSTLLRKAREAKGLTVQEISQITKVPVDTLYKIEIGRSGVNAIRAKNISLCLQEPLERLFEPSTYYAKFEVAEID